MHFGKYLVRRERVAGGTIDVHLARVKYRGRLGPRTTTCAESSSCNRTSVKPSESVAANSARVPTPVWKMNISAERNSSHESTLGYVQDRHPGFRQCGRRNGVPPYLRTRLACDTHPALKNGDGFVLHRRATQESLVRPCHRVAGFIFGPTDPLNMHK